ncbi:hypothetical protein RRG08_067207, partial [Elysia crispata]
NDLLHHSSIFLLITERPVAPQFHLSNHQERPVAPLQFHLSNQENDLLHHSSIFLITERPVAPQFHLSNHRTTCCTTVPSF